MSKKKYSKQSINSKLSKQLKLLEQEASAKQSPVYKVGCLWYLCVFTIYLTAAYWSLSKLQCSYGQLFYIKKRQVFSSAVITTESHVLKYSGTSQLRHHLGWKIYVVKQRCRCSKVFKMANKSSCGDFRRTTEHRPMKVQTKQWHFCPSQHEHFHYLRERSAWAIAI